MSATAIKHKSRNRAPALVEEEIISYLRFAGPDPDTQQNQRYPSDR
jgi:hypothetical protein